MAANDNYAVFSSQGLTAADIANFERMFDDLDGIFAKMAALNDVLHRVLMPAPPEAGEAGEARIADNESR